MGKFALINVNNIVENIIEYDEDAIKAGLIEYEVKLAAYEEEERTYNERYVAYANFVKEKRKELTALYGLEDPEEGGKIILAPEGAKKLEEEKRKFGRPATPRKPKKPLSEYTPPEGYEMIAVESFVDIGYIYNNGTFIKPEDVSDEL